MESWLVPLTLWTLAAGIPAATWKSTYPGGWYTGHWHVRFVYNHYDAPTTLSTRRGTQLWVTRHVPPKRPYFFSLAFTERPPFLTTFTKWPPYFSKISAFLTKCWEIFGHFGPESPYFLCISLKDPLFLGTLSLKDPFFWHNLSPKDPYIWGAWWHSYVTFICECPPGPVNHSNVTSSIIICLPDIEPIIGLVL